MKLITLMSTLLLTVSVSAANKGYDLKMELSLDGKIVSSPRMIVEEGKLSTITQEPKKDSTYKDRAYFEILASEGKIEDSKGILMKMKVGLIKKDGTKTIISNPHILAKAGEEAVIVVGQEGRPEITLKVIATRKNL